MHMKEFSSGFLEAALWLQTTEVRIRSTFWEPEVRNQLHWADVKVTGEPYSSRRLQGKSMLHPLQLVGVQTFLACGVIPPACACGAAGPTFPSVPSASPVSYKDTRSCI